MDAHQISGVCVGGHTVKTYRQNHDHHNLRDRHLINIIITIIIFPCDLALWVGWWVVVVCGGEGDTASRGWACSSICVPLCTGMPHSSQSSIIIITTVDDLGSGCRILGFLAISCPWCHGWHQEGFLYCEGGAHAFQASLHPWLGGQRPHQQA